MKSYKVVVPLVIYLIIAVGMLGIYKWVGDRTTYMIAMAWTFYAGFRALYLTVLGGKAAEQMLVGNYNQQSLVFMTIVVGVIPFLFLGWMGPLAFGCVSFAFEYQSYLIIRKYTWSKNHGRHYHQR